MIRSVFRLIRTLQSNANPSEIAAGGVLACYFGLTPWNHTHLIFLVLAFFFFKINRAATLLCLPFIKLLFIAGLYRVCEPIGFALLTYEPLSGFWAWFTKTPVLALLSFDHTSVLGGFVAATLIAIPVYFAIIAFVNAYRKGMKERMNRWGVVQWIQKITIVQLLMKWWPK